MITITVLSLVFTVAYTIFVFNLLQPPAIKWMGDVPPYAYNAVYFGVIYFFIALFTSLLSSFNYCNQVGVGRSIGHGIATSIVSVLVVLLIAFVPFLQGPFNELFGKEGLRSTIITHIFFLFFTVTILLIVFSHESAMNNCTVDTTVRKEQLKELNEYLDSEEPETDAIAVEVRN